MTEDFEKKLFVDLSTVQPNTTTSIAAKIQESSGRSIASPIFGVPTMAEAGKVICVWAGAKDAVSQVTPYTAGVIAKSFIYFSDQAPAKVSQLKILGINFAISIVEMIAEGLVVAGKSDLGIDALHHFL